MHDAPPRRSRLLIMCSSYACSIASFFSHHARGPRVCTTVPFCNISGDPKCLSSPPTRRRAVALALNRPGGPVGDKENGPFQFTFNGLLKVAFQGSHITSDAGLILVRELNERLGLEQRITDHLSDSRHGTNTQFRVADLLRQSVYSRLAGYEDLNDAVGAFSEERWRRKSTGMEEVSEKCSRTEAVPVDSTPGRVSLLCSGCWPVRDEDTRSNRRPLV